MDRSTQRGRLTMDFSESDEEMMSTKDEALHERER